MHIWDGFYTRLALDAEKHETVHVYISGEEAFTRETITKIPVARNLGGVYGGIGMNIHVNSKMFFGVGLTYEQYTGYAGGEDYFNKTRINAINLQTGLYFRID